MDLHIYQELHGTKTVWDLVQNWKNIWMQDEEKGNSITLQFLIDCTGFEFIISQEQATDHRSYSKLTKDLFKKRFVKSKFLFASKDGPNLRLRVEKFLEAQICINCKNYGCRLCLTNMIKFNICLYENAKGLKEMKMLSCYFSMIFLRYISELRNDLIIEMRSDKENVSVDSELDNSLRGLANKLIEYVGHGFWFDDIAHIQCSWFLNLIVDHPEFYILENNKIFFMFTKLFGINNRNNILNGIQTLMDLIKGAHEDQEINDQICDAVVEYVSAQADGVFITLLCHNQVSIMQPTFELINVVQRFYGKRSIFNEENMKYVIELFMHKNKHIQQAANKYMCLIMEPKTVLQKILKTVTKYETFAPLNEVIDTAYNTITFTDWKIYFNVMNSLISGETFVTGVKQMMSVLEIVLEKLHETYKSGGTNPEDAVVFTWNFITDLVRFMEGKSESIIKKLLSVFDFIYIEDENMNSGRCFTEFNSTITDLMNLLKNLVESSSNFTTLFDSFDVLLRFTKAFPDLDDSLNEFVGNYTQVFYDYITNFEEIEENYLRKCVFVSYLCLTRNIEKDEDYDEIYRHIVNRLIADNCPLMESNPIFWCIFVQVFIKKMKSLTKNDQKVSREQQLQSINEIVTHMARLLGKMESLAKQMTLQKSNLNRFEASIFFQNLSFLICCLLVGRENCDMNLVLSAHDGMADLVAIVLVKFKDVSLLEKWIIHLTYCVQKLDNIESSAKILRHFKVLFELKKENLAIDLIKALYTKDSKFFVVIAKTLLLLNTDTDTADFDVNEFWNKLTTILTENLNVQEVEIFRVSVQVLREIMIILAQITPNEEINRFEVLTQLNVIVELMKQSPNLSKTFAENIVDSIIKSGMVLNVMERDFLQMFKDSLMVQEE